MINANVRSTERMSDVNTEKKRGDSEHERVCSSLVCLIFLRSSSGVYPLYTSSRLMNNPASDSARHTSDASDRDTNYTPLIIFNEIGTSTHCFIDGETFPIKQSFVSDLTKSEDNVNEVKIQKTRYF